MKYPPFCDIILIGVSSKIEKEGLKVTNLIHEYLKNRVIKENIGIILYKGLPAPIDRIKNKYRFRIIIKCKFSDEIIELMNDVINMYEKTKEFKNTRVVINLNPNNML